MATIPKVNITPVPEGFVKVSGRSVEEVLDILETTGISSVYCYPYEYLNVRQPFREHTIIVRRADYERLERNGSLGKIQIKSNSVVDVGFYQDARYRLGAKIETETTQVRMWHSGFSREDGLFKEANGLTLVQVMMPLDYELKTGKWEEQK